MAATRSVRSVLISSDDAARETFNQYARSSGGGFSVALDLNVTLGELTATHFRSILEMGPVIVFIDFDTSPELGLSLARDLTTGSDDLVVVGFGAQMMASDLLLQAIRAGLSEYLVKPLTEGGLAEAIVQLLPKVKAPRHDAALARTLAFFSAKGGAGTSTMVTNLGIELHRRTGKRTLIVDLDAHLGEISLLLGVQPKFNFADLVQNFHRIDTNLLASYIEQHKSGVHLLSAPYHPEGTTTITEEDVRHTLLYLRGHYDYVLVDTSKSFSPAAKATFEQADEVFLLTAVDLASLRNIQRVLPQLKRFLRQGLEQVHLIINRYDPAGEVGLKDVQRSVGVPVYATLANDYASVIRSINTSSPVILNGSRSPYVRDIRGLAEKIVGIGPAATVNEAPGLLGRFRLGSRLSPVREEK